MAIFEIHSFTAATATLVTRRLAQHFFDQRQIGDMGDIDVVLDAAGFLFEGDQTPDAVGLDRASLLKKDATKS